jgi:hypothetical protein
MYVPLLFQDHQLIYFLFFSAHNCRKLSRNMTIMKPHAITILIFVISTFVFYLFTLIMLSIFYQHIFISFFFLINAI